MVNSRDITINGVQLNDPFGRWFIRSTTLPRQVSPRIHTSLQLAGQDGEVPMPEENRGVGTYSLVLVIQDHDELGVPKGPGQTDLNYQFIMNLIAYEFYMVETIGDQVKAAYGQANNGASAEKAPMMKTLSVTIPITLTDGTWFQPSASDTPFSITTDNQVVELAGLGGTTAPTTKIKLRLRGPMVSGALRLFGRGYDARAGQIIDFTGISYEEALSNDTQYLYIDVDRFQAWVSTSSTNWDNLTSSTSKSHLLGYPPSGKLRAAPFKAMDAGGNPIEVEPSISARITTGAAVEAVARAQGRYL